MSRIGRPLIDHPRSRGIFVRLSSTEWGAAERALVADHPVAERRPTFAEWVRDLVVAHSSEVLRVDVTRAGLKHQRGGAADWKRWRLAKAVRQAARRRRRRRIR